MVQVLLYHIFITLLSNDECPMRRPIMTRLLKLIPLLALIPACATTSDYTFPDRQAQTCFAPCKSSHRSCLNSCFLYSISNDSAVNSFISVACHVECRASLDQCARGCGAVKGGEAVTRSPSRDRARYRQLRAQTHQMKRAEISKDKLEELNSNCQSLHQRVAAKPGSSCPAKKTFLSICKELSPEVVRCLDPSVMAREGHWCKGQMRREDPSSAANMNSVLQQCHSKEIKKSKRAASQPASQQVSDGEDPG